MEQELKDNLKKQNTLFQKFKKATKWITVGVGLLSLGIAWPQITLYSLPSEIYDTTFGLYLSSVGALGMVTIGPIVSIYNAIKSKIISNKMKNLRDESSEMIEQLELENEKLRKKVDGYEKTTSKKEDKHQTKTLSHQHNLDYQNDLESEKTHSR